MSDLHQAGINDIQYSEAKIVELQAVQRAAMPSLSDERSVLGKAAESLVRELDEQNIQLRRIQARDQARLQSMSQGPARNELQKSINERAANIEQNNEFIERLYNEEHPTLVSHRNSKKWML